MSWRKYFALERRAEPRYSIAVDVQFYVWSEIAEKPLTGKVPGRLVNISSRGACLKTNTVRIGYHHLSINNDLEGKTPLHLEFPPSPEGPSWTLKAQILWYNRIRHEDDFKFEFGLAFSHLSPAQQKGIESLIKKGD